MSYQLRRNQTLGANLRRICRKQVEAALEIVRGEREANTSRFVHGVFVPTRMSRGDVMANGFPSKSPNAERIDKLHAANIFDISLSS